MQANRSGDVDVCVSPKSQVVVIEGLGGRELIMSDTASDLKNRTKDPHCRIINHMLWSC